MAAAPESFLGDRDRVHQPQHTFGGRDLGPNGEPIVILWKLDPGFFNGDPLKFRAFRKEAIMFADWYRFADVFGCTRDIT